MIECKLIYSNNAPTIKNAVWAQPVEGGFILKKLKAGKWEPMKVVNELKNDNSEVIKNELVGSVQDKKSANTINGAKAYAKDIKNSLIGTSSDTSADLTLKGLKAYIDEKIAGLE